MFKKSKFKGEARSLSDVKVATPVAAPVRKESDVATVKFEIRIKDKVERKEGKFATKQKLSSLYVFLEQEIFSQVEGLEIIQAFPRAVIPRDEEKCLAAMGIKGNVLLQVNYTSGKLK